MENSEQNQDVNQIALRAKQLTDMGQSLNPTYQDLNLVAETPQQQSYMDYFASHPEEKLDLNDPNTKATWEKIVKESSDRVTNYGEVFGQAAREMAMLPISLAQGIKESPNPLVWAGSTIEGIGRMYRDMFNLLTSSENPTSPIFHVRAAATSLITGKSRDWRAEVAQWNDARETNYNTHLMEEGKEVLLDRFGVHLSPEERERIKQYINPKIAHAMGFIGLELPAIGRALMTSGAKSAIAASTTGLAIEADAAKASSFFSKTKTRFENASGKIFQNAAGATLKGAGKVLEYPAAMVQGLVGANIERAAGGLGVTDSVIRNAAETAVSMSGEAAAGAGVKRTVGLLGSLGIRTGAEVAGAYGQELVNAAKGLIPRSQTGLTTLERLARNPNLSPTGKMVAKFLNVTVDPVLQLSTAALKNGYVGALEFGVLGYLNDRDKGALSGAAMGLVWSGYSGAFRHTWSQINGGFSHRLIIDQFDSSVLPQIEKSNPNASAKLRTILEAQDKLGHERSSANNRTAWDTMFQLFDPVEQRNAIIAFDDKSLQDSLQSKGVRGYQNARVAGKASFQVVKNAAGENVPIITMTPHVVRGADVGHEIFGHVVMHALEGKHKVPTFHGDLFGTTKDGGILPDSIMVEKWAQRRGSEYYLSPAAWKQYEISGKKAFDSEGNMTPEYKNWAINKDSLNIFPQLEKSFQGWLDEIRKDYPNKKDFLRGDLYEKYKMPQENPDFDPRDFNSQMHPGAKWMFEELVSGHMEGLYTFTNMRDILLSDKEKPLRYYMESVRNDMFAKKHLQQELAGMKVTEKKGIFDENGNPQVQLEVFDDGKWHKHPGMDEFAKKLIREAINLDNSSIYRLSPEKMAIEAKKHSKEYMFNPVSGGGVNMKGEKELNEISDAMSKKTFETIKNLPDNLKTEIALDEHGNETIDLTKLSDAAFDAIVKEGGMDATTATNAKAIRDVIRDYYDSGFASPNVMVSDYWAAEKEVVRGGVLGRLQGKDVPITHRMFVPYELKISNKVADANGKPLSKPKTTMTVTAVDYMAIHNNKISNWSRPEVRRLFTSIDEMNTEFDRYVINMMQDPSIRVPSEQLFKAKYGANASKVRDVMYNIFGAVMRKDEGFINTPGEEARTNVRGPNFPYHSLRLDRMVNLELTSSKPFGYHHGNSYEGFRRNLSTEGFERITEVRYRDMQGYEIFKSGRNFKVYSPFGQQIDVVDSFKRAAKVAGKHFKKIDDADKLPQPSFNANAFFGGAADTAQQKIVQDRLNSYLSNFDSRGRMLQCEALNTFGNVVKVNPELDFEKVNERINAPLVNSPNNLDKRLTIGHLLTTGTRAKFWFNRTFRGVSRTYNTHDIPVIFLSDSRNGFGHQQFISGFDTDVDIPSRNPFKEAEYVKYMRENREIVKIEITHRGPVMVIDGKSSLLKGFDKESANSLIQEHFRKEFNKLFNGTRPDSLRSGIGQDALPAVTSTYGASNLSLDWSTFNNAIKLNDFKLARDNRIKKLETKFKDKLNGPEWANLKNIGDSNDAAFHDVLTEISNYLYTHGEWYTHSDAEGKPATIIQLDEQKHGTQLAKLQKRKADIMNIVHGSSAAFKIYEYASDKLDHLQHQALGMRSGLAPIRKVVTLFTHPDNIKKSSPLMMVNDGFLREGNHNTFFIQPTSHGVVWYGSSEINKVAGSQKIKSANAAGGEMGDAQAAAGRQERGYTLSEDGVFKTSTSVRDMIASGDPEVINTFLDTAIADNVRDINVNEQFLKSRAHLTLTEILFKKYSNSEIFNNPKFVSLRKEAHSEGSSIESQIKYLEIIHNEAVMTRNSQAIHASNAAINLLQAIRIKNDPNTYLPNIVKNLMVHPDFAKKIITYPETNYLHRASQLNDVFYEWVGISGKGKNEKPLIYDLINSANEDPNFQHNSESLRQLELYSDKAHPYGQLGTVKTPNALLSVAGFKRPYAEEPHAFIKRMEETGLVRVIGNGLHRPGFVLFELSDKDASFTTKNNGRLELTPFIKLDEPQKALDDYMAAYGNKPSTGKYVGPKNVTLGDVFNHDEVYKHFPEMKDVPVLFTDGLGALAATYADPVTGELKYHIEFGVRNLLPEEAYKDATPYADKKLYPSYLYRNQFIKEHPATSMMLHEVQHILQYKFEHEVQYSFMGAKEKTMLQKNFLRYLGARNEDLNLETLESDHDAHQIVQGMVADINQSPVYKNLGAHVKPLLKTYIGRLAGDLAELADAGLVSGEHARTSLELMREIDTITSPEDAHRIYKSFESILGYVGTEPEVQLKMMQMYDDFHAAGSALEMHTVLDPANFGADQPMVHKIVSLKRAIDSFARANYFAKPIEVQARVTEKRRKLNKRELFEQPREDVPQEGSTLELITRISNSSGIMKIKNFDGKVDSFPRMLSVGDLKGGEDAADVTKKLGKLALVSYVALRGSKEFQKLGRFLITQNGWEVDKDGRLVLTKKNYTVKGDFEKFYKTQKEAEAAGLYDPTSDTGNPGYASYSYGQYSVIRGSTEGLQATYTIDDILALGNATIEAEYGLSVGNSVVDNVLHHTFPPMIKGDKVMEVLKGSAFSHSAEALQLSGIEQIAMAVGDRYVTKADLANLIMYYHNSLDISSVNAGETGVLPSKRSFESIDFDSIPREKLIAAAKDTVFPEVTGRLGIERFYHSASTSINFGVYRLDGRTLTFDFERPDWVPEDVYRRVVDKHLQSENYKKLQKTYLGEERNHSVSAEIANNLNERISRKLLLMEPVIKQMLKDVQTQREAGAINTDSYNAFVVGLFDKMVTDALVIHPSQFQETGNKQRGPLQDSWGNGRDNQTIQGTTVTNAIKRRGLTSLIQGTGATYTGLTVKGGEFSGFGYHTPVPMIGTAWHGTPFDFNEVANIHTSWFGTRIHPQGDTVPIGISTESVPDTFKSSRPDSGRAPTPFRHYYNAIDSVNNSLPRYESLHQCAINLHQGYAERVQETMDRIEGLEKTLAHYEQGPQAFADAAGIDLDKAESGRQMRLEQLEKYKRSLISDQYELNMSYILRDLFSLGNQRFLSDMAPDIGPSSGKMLRTQAVGGSKQQYIAFAPQYGVQTYQIGGRTLFDLDHIFCSLEDKSTLETKTGFGSGIPQGIRQKQADTSMLFDAQVRALMHSTHDYVEIVGDQNTPEMASVTPTQRHLPFFNLLGMITPETGGQTATLNFPTSMTIASGKSLVEIGLLANAVRLGKSKGIKYQTLITDMVTNQSLNFMQGSEGYLNNMENWRGLGTNFGGNVRFISAEMPRDFNLSVQHQSLGVASSVVLRHLLTRNTMFTHNEHLLYGTLPGIDTPAYMTAQLAGLDGEFNKPFAKLQPMQISLITDFVNQLPEKTKAYIASELSSQNNSLTILTSLGIINSLKLIKKQQENRAEFAGTIRHAIHPDFLGENGLSLQDSVDYAASHSLHTKIASTKEGERANLGGFEQIEIAGIMKELVESPEFWHGYFAASGVHKEIMVPNLATPYAFLDRRHRTNLFGKSTEKPLSQLDFNNDNGPSIAASRDIYTHDLVNSGGFLKFSTLLETNRYMEDVHGFNQRSTINLAGDTIQIEDSLSFPNRHAFSNNDPTAQIGTISNSTVIHSATRSMNPVTLEDYFHDTESNMNASSEPSNNIDYRDQIKIEDGSEKRRMTDDNSEVLKLNTGNSETSPVRIPILKTNIGKSLRDEIIKHQLALSARAYGAAEISSIAARHPLSVSVPTLFPGLTEASRIDYLRRSHVTTAFLGFSTHTSDIVGRNDIPRSGLSWTRLDDGRLMINYTPTIDLNQLFKMVNKEQQMGLPFKSGLGYDTASGTLIPQSSARMLWFSKTLAQSLRNGNMGEAAKAINGAIHFDQQTTNQHAKAFRALARNMSEGDPLSAEIKYHTQEGEALTAEGRADLANLLNPNNPVMFGLTAEAADAYHQPEGNYEPFHQQFLMDAMSQHNNHTFSYFTHVLPKDCTKEDINEVILSLHSAATEINSGGHFTDEMGFNSLINSVGFNKFSHRESVNYSTMYRMGITAWQKRAMPEKITQKNTISPELDSSGTSQRQSSLSNANLRKLASTNPDFASHIDEMASRAIAEPTGYSIPAAERKLKLNGDKADAIRVMFPGRDDLLKYAWDAGRNAKIDIFEKSDKSGFILSHDSITGMNADGTPQVGRISKTFKTRKDADAYATSLQNQGGIAGIPNVLFGENGYRVEKLNAPEAKGESAVNADITPVVSLIPDGEGNARTTISKTLYKVGNLDGVYTKKQATELAKMLKSQDVITGKAPEIKRNIMLSAGNLETAADLERIVRARSSFGVAGSPFTFTSNLMKAIAAGALDRNKTVAAYTGTEWFKILKANGVSKGEMRVTGVAAMLHNAKDHHITRDEFAQFAAAMYPTFYATIDRKDIPQTNSAQVARRITDPQMAINRIVHEHADEVGKIETSLRTRIYAEQNPVAKQVYTTILDNIRNTMISSLAEVYGNEKTMKLFEDRNASVGQIISQLKWDTSKEGTPPITAGSFWLFRHNLSKSYSDVVLSNLANSVGIDLKEFELTVDDFNHSRTENAMEPIVGQDGYNINVADAGRIGEYGYGLANRTTYRGYSSGYGDPSVNILHGGFNDATEITKIDNFITKLKSELKVAADEPTKQKLQKMIESASNVRAVRKSFAIRDLYGKHPGHRHFNWFRPGIWEIGHLRFTGGVATLHTNMGDGPLALAEAFNRNLAEQEIVPTLILEETQSDNYQKMNFGKMEANQVLPSSAEEAASIARLPELTKLQHDIEKAKSKRGDLMRETRILNKPGMWNDSLLNAAMMRARLQQAHITTKYALLKGYEGIFSGDSWKNNSNKGPEELLQGLIVKNGQKIKIPKEVQDKFGLPAEIEDFNIDDNHMFAGWLYKELAEGYLNEGTGSYFGANPQMNLVRQLFGDVIPYVELPIGNEDYYGGTRTFQMDSQGLMTLKLLKTASMFDENLAATIPRLLSEIEAKESFYGVNYDFDALGKRSIEILENRLRVFDQGQNINPKGRAFLGRVIADLKAMDQMDGRRIVMPERRMEQVSEQKEGWVGGDKRFNEPESRAELKTIEALTMDRIFVVSDIMDCYDRSINNRASEDTTTDPKKFKMFVQKLMENKRISHSLGNAHSPISIQGTVKMSYVEALKMQMEIYAAMHSMDLNEFMATSKHQLIDAYKNGIGLNGADRILDGWNVILESESVRDGNSPFPAFTAPTDMNDASYSSARIAPPAAQLSSRTVLGRYLETTFPSLVNIYKSKKFISEQNANVQRLESLQKEIKIEIISDPNERTYALPDVLPLGEEGAYRGIQSSYSVMKAIQERQTAVSYIDGRYHIARYHNQGDVKIMYNLSNGKGGFLTGSGSQMVDVVSAYLIGESQKSMANSDFFGRIMRGELTQADVGQDGKFTHGGQVADLQTHFNLAVQPIFDSLLVLDNDAHEKIKRNAFEMIKSMVLRSKNDQHIDIAIQDHFGTGEFARVQKIYKGSTACLVAVPYGRANGYTTNYGLPSWAADINLTGQSVANRNRVKHDLYTRPVVEHSDGVFNILDPKTGKLLVGDLTDPAMVKERIAQLSKYEGAVPIVSSWLGTFKRAGMYFTNSHLFNQRSIETGKLPGFGSALDGLGQQILLSEPGADPISSTYNNMVRNLGQTTMTADLYRKTETSVQRHPQISKEAQATYAADVPMEEGQSRGRGDGYYGPGVTQHLNDKPAVTPTLPSVLYAMGVTKKSSSAEIAAAIVQSTGFIAPSFVVKPKFPTDAHKFEMRKMVVDGIPLMSVGDFKNPNIKAKRALSDYKWLTDRFKTRPMPRNNDDETTNR